MNRRGGDAVMDPLKMAHGVKIPLHHKQDKIEDLQNQQKRYYPIDARGDVDEWGAVQQHRTEVYQRQKAEEQIQKHLNQKDYHKELDQAVQNKKQREQMEQERKESEKDYMARNLQMRANKDQQQLETQISQKAQFSELARSQIDQMSYQKRLQKEKEMEEEQRLLQRDQNAAFQYNQNKIIQKEAARDLLLSNNDYLLREKQKQQEFEREQAKAIVGLSPGHIGWGYHNQRRYLEEVDKNQDRLNQNFHKLVVQPQIEKTLFQLEKERQLELEAKMRMDASASYVQQQQFRVRQNHDAELRRQIEEQDFLKKAQNENKRQIDNQLLNNQLMSNAIIQHETQAVKLQNTLAYKQELDRHKQLADQMKSYGNMSAAEKQINRDDLYAYKEYDGKNYAMIPGIQQSKQINQNRLSASPMSKKTATGTLGSPGRKENEEKLQENAQRLKNHGAVHLGKELSTYEPKNFLGSGNLLNGALGHNQNRMPSPLEKLRRADSLYSGPAGSALGTGRMHPDGTLDRLALVGNGQNLTPLTPSGQMQLSLNASPIYASSDNSRVERHRGLKAQPHAANGGIGVSYSNVMLGGLNTVADPGAMVPDSTYRNHFVRDRMSLNNHQNPLSPDNINNQTHKNRFLNNQQVTLTGAPQSNNNIAFVKGIDFNSQQKYDYNILNNLPHNGVSQAVPPQPRPFNYG